ncbi:MAG: hypothetical protein A2Y66_07700 [Nitrospirae bacterium RBG_13_41_22]|nr:MAG: hypothetical protein A2Y66_07700 [Nitrospirae bacterium RBG_13_41_22]
MVYKKFLTLFGFGIGGQLRCTEIPACTYARTDEQSSASSLTAHRLVAGGRAKPTPPIKAANVFAKNALRALPPAASRYLLSAG